MGDFRAWAGVFEANLDWKLVSLMTRLLDWNEFLERHIMRGSLHLLEGVSDRDCAAAFVNLQSLSGLTISAYKMCREVQGRQKSAFDLA